MSTLARVADLAEQIRGVSYSKEEASSTPRPGYLPILRAGNITDDGLVFDDLIFVPAHRITDKQKIRRNDVVIAASSGSLDVVGKAARALDDFEGSFGAFCKVLRPGPDVDPCYFSHFFRTPEYRHRVSTLAAGVNINNLRNEHLDEMLIPLPPLLEQRRIAEILDKADALRAERRATLKKLDELTQTIFLDMFGDPARNPMGWPTRSFDEVMIDETSCSERLPQSNFLKSGRYPVVDQGQATIAGYCDDERFLCRSALPVVVFGDHTRTVKLVKKPFVIGADGAKVLVPRPGMTAEFLSWLLRLSPIPNLGYSRHMRELKRLSFPVPPLSYQEKFADALTAIDQHRHLLQAAQSGCDDLFLSLQHRAFQGDL